MCVLAAVATVPRWRARLAKARVAVDGKRLGAVKVSVGIREHGRKNLQIKRAIRQAEAKIEITQAAIDDVLKKISVVEQVDTRIYVVDDRRGRADAQWIGVISHRNYQGVINPLSPPDQHIAWRDGRRCLVWAKTEQAARSRLVELFPPEKGFSLTSVDMVPGSSPEAEGKND